MLHEHVAASVNTRVGVNRVLCVIFACISNTVRRRMFSRILNGGAPVSISDLFVSIVVLSIEVLTLEERLAASNFGCFFILKCAKSLTLQAPPPPWSGVTVVFA